MGDVLGIVRGYFGDGMRRNSLGMVGGWSRDGLGLLWESLGVVWKWLGVAMIWEYFGCGLDMVWEWFEHGLRMV